MGISPIQRNGFTIKKEAWTGKLWEKEQKTTESLEDMDDWKKMQEKKSSLSTEENTGGSVEYAPSEDLLKLMEAKTVGEVRSLMGKIKAQMGRIKASGADAEAIKEAVAKMKKVLKKAKNKEKALLKEQKMELQRKLAERREDLEEAKEIDTELKGKRASRRLKEITDVLGAENLLEQSSQMEAKVLELTGAENIGEAIDIRM